MGTSEIGTDREGKFVRILGHDYYSSVMRPLGRDDYLYITGTVGMFVVVILLAAIFWASTILTILTGTIPCDGSALAWAAIDALGATAFMPWPMETAVMQVARPCGVYEWQRNVAITVTALMLWKIGAKLGVVRLIASRKGFRPVYVQAPADDKG
jgi:hypothetical protein